jgi:hypothetical protein
MRKKQGLSESAPASVSFAEASDAGADYCGECPENQEDAAAGYLLSNPLSGFNFESGIDRFGTGDGLITALQSYATHTPELLAAMRDPEKDLAAYTVSVHGVKGSSYGVGAMQCGAEAEALEKAAREKNTAFVLEHNAPFIDATQQLLQSLSSLLEKYQNTIQNSGKPHLAAPDPALLARIKKSAEEYDIAALDEEMTELESYTYDTGGELIAWLKEHIETSDFEEIDKKL